MSAYPTCDSGKSNQLWQPATRNILQEISSIWVKKSLSCEIQQCRPFIIRAEIGQGCSFSLMKSRISSSFDPKLRGCALFTSPNNRMCIFFITIYYVRARGPYWESGHKVRCANGGGVAEKILDFFSALSSSARTSCTLDFLGSKGQCCLWSWFGSVCVCLIWLITQEWVTGDIRSTHLYCTAGKYWSICLLFQIQTFQTLIRRKLSQIFALIILFSVS